MLRNEAEWLRHQLEAIATEQLSPLLSIGSGSAAARGRQHWIDELVFAPLANRGVAVLHHEHAPASGVDVAGDLTEPGFLTGLRELRVRSVLCANVLEHLADPGPVAGALEDLVDPGGRLIVTVPRRYPYHPDPIDTMFRPSVPELAALFPRLCVIAGEEVRCESLLSYARSVRGKRTMVANGVRAAVRRRPGGAQPERGGSSPKGAGAARYLLAPTAVTCVVLGRPDEATVSGPHP